MNYAEAMKELYGDLVHPNVYMENDDFCNADKFWVQSTEKNSYIERFKPEVEEDLRYEWYILKTVIESIKDYKSIREDVSSIICDFVLNSDDKWYFINLVSFREQIVYARQKRKDPSHLTSIDSSPISKKKSKA